MIATTTLAIAALAVTAIGAGVSYMGAQEQASAQSNALNYQAQVAANNAKIQAQNVEQSRLVEEQTEANASLKASQIQGGIRAAAAASGIDPNSGSPLDIEASSKTLANSDALTIRSNFARQQFGLSVAGMSDLAQAGLDRAGADQALVAGNFAGMNSLLSGASSVSSKWEGFSQAGVNGF